MSSPALELVKRDSAMVAIHEASHAVAALASGIPLERISVAASFQEKHTGGVTTVVNRYQYRPEYGYVLVAGRVGTEIYQRRPCSVEEAGATFDYQLFWYAHMRNMDWDKGLVQMEEECRMLLHVHWTAVIAIAGALLAAPTKAVRQCDKNLRSSYNTGIEEVRTFTGYKARMLFEACGFPHVPRARPLGPPI